ncbi:hypothetical protein GUJ93_ZPchr0012g21801 [Zizania palustris]|nr:hypothetical protein GUJ93_ZPchr0012g21801 [Zizania palustris]
MRAPLARDGRNAWRLSAANSFVLQPHKEPNTKTKLPGKALPSISTTIHCLHASSHQRLENRKILLHFCLGFLCVMTNDCHRVLLRRLAYSSGRNGCEDEVADPI